MRASSKSIQQAGSPEIQITGDVVVLCVKFVEQVNRLKSKAGDFML